MAETDHPQVLLIRHGRTALNAAGRLRGLADPELDDTGIAEAEAAAEALRGAGIGYLTSSPLQRAERTAQIIAEAVAIPRGVDQGLIDRDYGPSTGKSSAEVITEWGSVDDAPGVEPLAAVRDRALGALDQLLVRHGGRRVFGVVTHDAVIRALLEAFAPGIRAEVATGSWAELRRAGAGWQVISVDNLPA